MLWVRLSRLLLGKIATTRFALIPLLILRNRTVHAWLRRSSFLRFPLYNRVIKNFFVYLSSSFPDTACSFLRQGHYPFISASPNSFSASRCTWNIQWHCKVWQPYLPNRSQRSLQSRRSRSRRILVRHLLHVNLYCRRHVDSFYRGPRDIEYVLIPFCAVCDTPSMQQSAKFWSLCSLFSWYYPETEKYVLFRNPVIVFLKIIHVHFLKKNTNFGAL